MNILVTGSSGHLGEALLRTLRGTDHRLISIDILPSEYTDVVGSICDRELVRECMSGVDVVLHTATLHKPHIVTHSRQDFVDTNITGTLHLLEEALTAGVQSFIFTSTTSAFGDALRPPAGEPAAWVTEELLSIPKNIYGVTKIAAEDLCALFYRNFELPCLILRTSRFFLEQDDKKEIRQAYEDDNIKVNEFLYRRVDIEDVVHAHLLAMEKAPKIGFGRYIISATTPFTPSQLQELRTSAPGVLKQLFPDYEKVYTHKGWKMFPSIERVYVNEKARKELSWRPKYDFRFILDRVKAGADYLSPLARNVGIKHYHTTSFENGPYPI